MTAGEGRYRDEQAQWFGENIRKNRERKQMSQEDLAREMTARGWPWHQSTVYKVEHGSRRTEAFELHNLAEILGVPIAQLFWPPGEVNEIATVDMAIAKLRRAWHEAAQSAVTLLAARAWAGRTLEQHADSKYERVRAVCGELEGELATRSLHGAMDEAEDRYEHRDEET